MLDAVNHPLASNCIRITTGTIVGPTIIHAPRSTKNQKRERDPEMQRIVHSNSSVSPEGAQHSNRDNSLEYRGFNGRPALKS
jgi:hypothetical protein